MAEKAHVHQYGREKRLGLEAQAEKLVKEELKRLGWREAELEKRRKGDPGKAAIAARLRAETTMTADWIARRLQMGSESYVRKLTGAKGKSANSWD